MLTIEQFMMGRDEEYPPSDQLMHNASMMVDAINRLAEEYGSDFIMTSGYRPNEVNANICGAVQGDAHSRCSGIDIHDPDGQISAWCLKHQDILAELDLWMEDPKSAKNHLHLQNYPPKSGKRVFIA